MWGILFRPSYRVRARAHVCGVGIISPTSPTSPGAFVFNGLRRGMSFCDIPLFRPTSPGRGAGGPRRGAIGAHDEVPLAGVVRDAGLLDANPNRAEVEDAVAHAADRSAEGDTPGMLGRAGMLGSQVQAIG